MDKNDLEILLRETISELWIKDPPLSLPIEQSIGWNNALAAFGKKMKDKLNG